MEIDFENVYTFIHEKVVEGRTKGDQLSCVLAPASTEMLTLRSGDSFI
jgi:hypothetical protein